MSALPNCVWCGPVFEPTGYADEGRGLLFALEQAGVPVALRATAALDPDFRLGLPSAMREALEQQQRRAIRAPYVLVQHYLADGFADAENAAYLVGRTMFETDSLPPHWVSRCNTLDELWVPSTFNEETFRRAGVRTPIFVVPGGIDTELFTPAATPLSLEGLQGTVFLAVFEWRARKGWDVLLRAWAEAFSPLDNVTLLLRTHAKRVHGAHRSGADQSPMTVRREIERFLADACDGRSFHDVAPIVVLAEDLPADAMPSLYACANAFVAPTRGEGWGRPFMEAMATGLPVIATRWSAHLDYMTDDNSLLIANMGLVDAHDPDTRAYDGHRWASPSAVDLVKHLRFVHDCPDEARAIGARARHDMETHWPWSRAAAAITERLHAIDRIVRHGSTARPVHSSDGDHRETSERLCVEASVFEAGSLTGVETLLVAMADACGNKMRVYPRARTPRRPAYSVPAARLWPLLERYAGRAGDIEGGLRSVAPRAEAAPTGAWATEHARSVTMTWLDRSDEAPPVAPSDGAWIVCTGDRVRGSVPAALTASLLTAADEVWVPHHAAYEACTRIGVDQSRLWIMPFGVITDRHTPDAARFQRPRDVDTVLLLPVFEDADIASAELLLRVWQRVAQATDSVRLQLLVPQESRAPNAFQPSQRLSQWGASLQARFRSGRLAPGLTAEVLVTNVCEDTLPAYVCTADVIIAPGATNSSVWHIALACGRPLIVPASADAEPLREAGGAWVIPTSTAGAMDTLCLATVLRETLDPRVRLPRVDAARAYAGALPSWATIADEVLQRCARLRATARSRFEEAAR